MTFTAIFQHLGIIEFQNENYIELLVYFPHFLLGMLQNFLCMLSAQNQLRFLYFIIFCCFGGHTYWCSRTALDCVQGSLLRKSLRAMQCQEINLLLAKYILQTIALPFQPKLLYFKPNVCFHTQNPLQRVQVKISTIVSWKTDVWIN